MKENSKCFILAPDGFEEITYAELTQRRETNATYRDKRFIPLHGMLLEVSEVDYKSFYRDRRRQKYLEEEAVRSGSFSYNALDSDEMSGEDIIVDQSPLTDEIALDKLLLEKMRLELDKLSEDDRALLTALYFKGRSERELAKELGISQVAVHKRRHKAIAKLKSMLRL